MAHGHLALKSTHSIGRRARAHVPQTPLRGVGGAGGSCEAERGSYLRKNMEEAVPPPEARLADEVRAVKPSARRKRAKAAGAAEEEIEACAIRGGVNFNFLIKIKKKTPTIHSYTGVLKMN